MSDRMPLRIDLVSDVVCPWCIIGYRQFQKALAGREQAIDLELHWHAFELNPQMPAEGQNLREHLAGKYGTTPEQSRKARQRLTDIGAELGFTFNYSDDMKMVNTFRAHQLLHWAAEQGCQTALKEALFKAFFTDGQDVSETDTLADICVAIGLDRDEALAVLADARYGQAVREDQRQWVEQGIQAVPTFVINEQYMVQGAQDAEAFGRMLDRLLERHAA
ncbi:MAG: DsbA family oxidoreductase [Halieaceae bacterium]|nr:DsbA family oxidoreductase [Halieaceae bacterium]